MRADVVVYNLLKNDANVAAFTSKIFPRIAPQTVDPNLVITYSIITTNSIQTQTMEINTDMVTVQVSCFARSYDNTQGLADAVVEALHSKSGTVSVSGNDYHYKNIRIVGRNDLGFDDENEVYMIAIDFSIMMIV
jgi:ABC-type branched-subunit amino acid transport system substrate-binding protein